MNASTLQPQCTHLIHSGTHLQCQLVRPCSRKRTLRLHVRAYTNKPPGSSPSQRVAFPQRSRQQQQLTRIPLDRVPATAGSRNHKGIIKRKHQIKEPTNTQDDATQEHTASSAASISDGAVGSTSSASTAAADAQRRQRSRTDKPSTSGRQHTDSPADRLQHSSRKQPKVAGPAGAPKGAPKGFASSGAGKAVAAVVGKGGKQGKQNGNAGTAAPKSAKGWQAHRDWLLMSMEDGLMDDKTYRRLADKLSLEEHWRPQISVLWQLGMREHDISKLLDARIYVIELGVPTLQNKFRFLNEQVGLSNEDIVKLLNKFPRILEYKLASIQKRLDFFAKHGVAQDEWSKIVMRAPMLLELSISNTLEPRIKYLITYGHVASPSVGKLISRHPQVLTCTEDGVKQRVDFLTRLGMQPEDIGRAVVAHPQILHYSVSAMERRVQYLLDIGMSNEQAAAAFTRLPQLFSLDVTNNLAPKFDYLVKQLGGGVDSVSSYPGYFSLSLANRIIPRHRFLETLYKPVPRPFPMNYLKCSDKKFAHDVAGSSLVRFENFRSQMQNVNHR